MVESKRPKIGLALGSGGGKRGRAKIPSPNPLPFCPPGRLVWRAKRG